MVATTGRAFPRHTHDQYGIGVIDAGAHASASDRGQVEAGAGSLIFVNPGEVHDGRAVGGRLRSWRMLYFDPMAIEAARADVLDGSNTALTFAAPALHNESLRRGFNVAFRRGVSTAHPEAMECETAILRLTALIQVNSTACPRHVTKSTASVRRARDKIDADPAMPLTLAGLAGEAGVSRYQLLRGFARELRLTPHAYILQQRIALARRLIRSGRPLAEAATLAGFYDQSHLTRCFLRQFGVTPGRYAA